jgi:putative acetyltransferase
MSAPIFRPVRPEEVSVLAEIYIDAVRSLGGHAYSPSQVSSWASWPSQEPEEFLRRTTAGHTWVAEYDHQIAAFAEFTPPNHLDFLYTRGAYARRGFATQLHARLQKIARESGASELVTEASYLSRPAFTKFGYQVTAVERVERFGELFTRFIMLKRLTLGPPATNPAARILRAHAPTLPQAPRAAAEDIIQFLAHDENNPGWFRGIDASGIEGYFPRDWFMIDATHHRATALRDYVATELKVSPGDTVYPIAAVGLWLQVITVDWQTGWIPQACLPAPAN